MGRVPYQLTSFVCKPGSAKLSFPSPPSIADSGNLGIFYTTTPMFFGVFTQGHYVCSYHNKSEAGNV